ncbi:hypothetical protein RRG08_063698 [Elysia crispata]|uniref:Uncharacterized protein n=1 Tax=Elysia crispata TaxID=231223 RepID=A0AAE1DCP2_9GAST|nr:hypothetical protein RRG08_063698 [Elysia crispata]
MIFVTSYQPDFTEPISYLKLGSFWKAGAKSHTLSERLALGPSPRRPGYANAIVSPSRLLVAPLTPVSKGRHCPKSQDRIIILISGEQLHNRFPRKPPTPTGQSGIFLKFCLPLG